MKALTGMTVAEFERLLPRFGAGLNKAQTKTKQDRNRAVGGGRGPPLKTSADKLFFILLDLKCYPTSDLAGLLYGVDRSPTQRWVKTLLPVLAEGLGWQVGLAQRRMGSLEEFIQHFAAVKAVFIAGTERPGQRPQQAKAHQKLYSGKQKDHTLKNLLVSAEGKRILCLTPTKAGARQDYYRFKQSGRGEVIPDAVNVWVDLGFMAMAKDYPRLRLMIPPNSSKNHPLTPLQKAENRVIRALRICLEPPIAGVKRVRCVTDPYPNKGVVWADKFMLIACGLWTYHLLPT